MDSGIVLSSRYSNLNTNQHMEKSFFLLSHPKCSYSVSAESVCVRKIA